MFIYKSFHWSISEIFFLLTEFLMKCLWKKIISIHPERWSRVCGQSCLMEEWILVCTSERTCVYNKHILSFSNNICDEVLCNLLFVWLVAHAWAESFFSTKIWSLLFSKSLELWRANSYLVNKKYSLSILNCLLHMEVTSVVIHVCNAPPEKSGPLNAILCK